MEVDRQLWLILDDTQVLCSGCGPEMVQLFCYLAGTGTYELTSKQRQTYADLHWEGPLRLVRQQSCFENKVGGMARKSSRVPPKRRKQTPKAQTQINYDNFE
jgi:hypothetical protein